MIEPDNPLAPASEACRDEPMLQPHGPRLCAPLRRRHPASVRQLQSLMDIPDQSAGDSDSIPLQIPTEVHHYDGPLRGG